MKRALFWSLMVTMMCSHSISFAAYRWTISVLPSDSSTDEVCWPVVSNNGRVAWTSSCDPEICGDVFYFDGSSTEKIDTLATSDWEIDINDEGRITWFTDHCWNNGDEIFMFDGDDLVFLSHGRFPRINNLGHVVFHFFDEIFFFNGVDTVSITENSVADLNCRINDSDMICWTVWDPDAEIVCRESPTGADVVLTDNEMDDWYLRLNNIGQVVWMGGECPHCEIYFYNGEEIQQVTNNSFEDRDPRINDLGQIVWWGGSEVDSEAFLFDGIHTRKLSVSTGDARYPDINDKGQVVWEQRDAYGQDIFFYDGKTTYQITDGCDRYYTSPQINDHGVVVWSRSGYVLMAEPVGVAEAQWGKTIGGLGDDSAKAVEITVQGGYLILGETDSFGFGNRDLWIVELDEHGSVLWQKVYEGPGDEVPTAMKALTYPAQGYVVVGSTTSSTSDDDNAWVMRIREDGTVNWQREYGTTADDSAVAVVSYSGCSFVVAGETRDPISHESENIWLMKLNRLGGVVWRKTYASSNFDKLSSFQKTHDRGFLLAGETHHFAERVGDFWVLKTDGDGVVEWENAYGLKGFVDPDHWNENIEYAPQAIQTHDGSYILAGTTVPWTNKHMIWVLKLAADGSIIWQKLFSGPGDSDLASVRQAVQGGYVLSGATGSTGDGWVMKLDENGVKEWDKYYGGGELFSSDEITSVQTALDDGYIAVGYTESLAAAERDMWILKLDENGFIPDCPSIRPGSLTAEEDPADGPWPLSSSVGDISLSSEEWTVTVTAPPSVHVLEGDGCTQVQVSDLIDLPATGQTMSYHAGDDGEIQAGVPWPLPRFVDNGDGTVTDHLTGLIWLKDANCLGATDWESAIDRIGDFNMNPEAFSCTDYDSENHRNDWRAPNINEMESLVNAGTANVAAWLVGEGFVNVTPNLYWSSSTPSTTYRRWAVNMQDGMPVRGYGPDWSFRMWPVRGGCTFQPDPAYPASVWKTGQTTSYYPGDDGDIEAGVAWPAERFTDQGDGTVVDNLTGLIWLKDSQCFEGSGWEAGLDTIAAFNAEPGGFDCDDYDAAQHQTGWRVPNKNELLSLMHRSKAGSALPDGHPFLNVGPASYWSSTTYLYMSSQSPQAWIADPTQRGTFNSRLKEHGQQTVWPVRGSATCSGDCDQDGDMDGVDLAAFQLDLVADDPEGPCRADFNLDGHVDAEDLARFALHFGRGNCPVSNGE